MNMCVSNEVKWRCFHCDATFTAAEFDKAREHFGRSEIQEPVCQIDGAKFREMELAFERSRDEDTDLHREIHRAENEGVQAARRAEEAGYARGLKDGTNPHECLAIEVTYKNDHQQVVMFSKENLHAAFLHPGIADVQVFKGIKVLYPSLAAYYADNPKAV